MKFNLNYCLIAFLIIIVLFGVGSIVMRGAGCTYNDIIDKEHKFIKDIQS